MSTKKGEKKKSIRVQLNGLTVPVLKDILRSNHQNPFGTKLVLVERIVYLAKNGAYPDCPKCQRGRLKFRRHRRKDQSKYYCPGYPTNFRSPASYHRCDYVTDECEKIRFVLPERLNLIVNE